MCKTCMLIQHLILQLLMLVRNVRRVHLHLLLASGAITMVPTPHLSVPGPLRGTTLLALLLFNL